MEKVFWSLFQVEQPSLPRHLHACELDKKNTGPMSGVSAKHFSNVVAELGRVLNKIYDDRMISRSS
jgi:hypothetical protein